MLPVLIVSLLLLTLLFGLDGLLVGLVVAVAGGAGYQITALLRDLDDHRRPPR